MGERECDEAQGTIHACMRPNTERIKNVPKLPPMCIRTSVAAFAFFSEMSQPSGLPLYPTLFFRFNVLDMAFYGRINSKTAAVKRHKIYDAQLPPHMFSW